MDKILEKAKDVHVRAIVAYVNSNKLYFESAHTNEVDAASLIDMFNKGLIIVDSSKYYAPVSLSVASNGAATVTYVKADTTTASTAVLTTITCSVA